MKKIIIISILMITSIFVKSQSTFPQGTYISELGDIIIRNDSVISEGNSYYVFYFRSSENVKNGITTISYESENRMNKLVVSYKSGTPRYLMFNYNNYSKESYSIAFIPGQL